MHNSLLNQAKSTEELNHDLTLQVKNLQEIIKDNEVKLNSKEQHITKMEVDQSAQQMQIENLEQLISVHADELSAKNKQLEISGSNFEALRLQFNEITASNDLLKKELDEAHMEIHRLQNLSNEFEKVKEFEIAMRPELKTAETQSDPIVFESEGGEPKEFLKLKATMPFIDSCETLNLQSQHRPLEIQNVQFVNIQPVQQPSRADEIFDVKAFDLSAVTNGNNSICFSTEPELFEEHVNRELMDKINALDEIVTKFEQENVHHFNRKLLKLAWTIIKRKRCKLDMK